MMGSSPAKHVIPRPAMRRVSHNEKYGKGHAGTTSKDHKAPTPIKHGTNPKGTAPHTKFKTDTEHEEYHDIYPTKDLNEAEMKEASKKKNTIKIKQPTHKMPDGTIMKGKTHKK